MYKIDAQFLLKSNRKSYALRPLTKYCVNLLLLCEWFKGTLALLGTNFSTDVRSVTASDCRKLSRTAATVRIVNFIGAAVCIIFSFKARSLSLHID